MDPVTAFSLFCTVLDLVDKTVGYALLVKKLYDQGVDDSNQDLENSIHSMDAVVDELRNAHSTAANQKNRLDLRIAAILSKCADISKSLQAVLNKCKPTKPGSWAKAMSAAVRTKYNGSTISEYKDKLDECRTELSILFQASA